MARRRVPPQPQPEPEDFETTYARLLHGLHARMRYLDVGETTFNHLAVATFVKLLDKFVDHGGGWETISFGKRHPLVYVHVGQIILEEPKKTPVRMILAVGAVAVAAAFIAGALVF